MQLQLQLLGAINHTHLNGIAQLIEKRKEGVENMMELEKNRKQMDVQCSKI